MMGVFFFVEFGIGRPCLRCHSVIQMVAPQDCLVGAVKDLLFSLVPFSFSGLYQRRYILCLYFDFDC